MSQDSSTGDREQIPDVIPADLLRDHLEDAHVTVVASHYLRNLRQPTHAQLAAERLRRSLDSWSVPLALVVVAVASSALWLGPTDGARTAFLAASMTTVLAITTAARWIWRRLPPPVRDVLD